MNDTLPWHQVNVSFPDWNHAEDAAAARIAVHLDAQALAATWWFIRKSPCWRIRYQPAAPEARGSVERYLDELAAAGHVTGWTSVVYEPEVHAFGGMEAMAAAHRLFHADSRAVLAYLRDQPGGRHRREISLMLASVMMRAARQDWFEQGDTWARVASRRKPPPGTALGRPGLPAAVRHLITADAESQMRDGAPLAHCARWAAAWTDAGTELACLAGEGRLHRGLRDVLAHHVIFAWNRLGLPYETQSALAGTAKTVVFGPDPATAQAG
jgi:thiopeptide-type bacteriocin biosynthesis protein